MDATSTGYRASLIFPLPCISPTLPRFVGTEGNDEPNRQTPLCAHVHETKGGGRGVREGERGAPGVRLSGGVGNLRTRNSARVCRPLYGRLLLIPSAVGFPSASLFGFCLVCPCSPINQVCLYQRHARAVRRPPPLPLASLLDAKGEL